MNNLQGSASPAYRREAYGLYLVLHRQELLTTASNISWSEQLVQGPSLSGLLPQQNTPQHHDYPQQLHRG